MGDQVSRLDDALVGRYRILRAIGEGGMAVVYLADDLRHQRQVAIKVLKPEISAALGSERFLAEIRTTANLQHPNILPLFDSGVADGLLYFVMPFVDGESLRSRLDREPPLTVDQAVRIGTEVAEALGHAHGKGVIHRDIKPSNILLQEGRPLVADFGIALAVGKGAGSRLTETGLSLGTPAYMSPEQATGEGELGPPADVWALGCVLYEMLAGEPPFVGKTAQALLAKILTTRPVPLGRLRSTVPGHVAAAVEQALEKSPADRHQDARALATALGTDGAAQQGRRDTGAARSHVSAARQWITITVVIVGISFALAGAVTLLARGLARREVAVAPTAAAPVPGAGPLRFTIPVGESQGGALLADGSGLVLTIRGPNRLSQLWERRWNDIELRPIAGTEGDLDATPAASPFSNEVAFVDGSTLKAVSLRGGAPRVLADSVDCCLFWGVDGYVYFVRTPGSRVFRVPEGGGTARLVEERPTWMLRVGADGDVTVRMTRTTPPRIQATSLTTGQTRILAEGSNPYLLPTGHLVYASPDGKILAARFDAASLSFVRDPIPIVEGVSVNAGGVASYEVSASGTMLHVASTPQDGAWELVWMTRGGLATQVDPGWIFVPGTGNASWALSPDGSRVAYRARTDAGFDIWVKDLPSGPPTRLTLDPGEEADPRWTADGDRVTFVSDRGGNLDLWSARADGADAPVLVHDHPTPLAEGFVSPDGAWTVVRLGATADNPGARDILFASRGSIPRVLSANAAYAEERPTLSPDGRWIAYTSDESGRREVYVRPFPDVQAGKVQVSRNGGGAPVWSRTGEELYYVEPGPPTLMSTQLDPANGMRVDGAERLFAFPANHFADRYDVAPDGRFLVGRAVPREREIVITVNFMSELEQLVP